MKQLIARIVRLHEQGLRYKEIDMLLELDVLGWKSYCIRNSGGKRTS